MPTLRRDICLPRVARECQWQCCQSLGSFRQRKQTARDNAARARLYNCSKSPLTII